MASFDKLTKNNFLCFDWALHHQSQSNYVATHSNCACRCVARNTSLMKVMVSIYELTKQLCDVTVVVTVLQFVKKKKPLIQIKWVDTALTSWSSFSQTFMDFLLRWTGAVAVTLKPDPWWHHQCHHRAVGTQLKKIHCYHGDGKYSFRFSQNAKRKKNPTIDIALTRVLVKTCSKV